MNKIIYQVVVFSIIGILCLSCNKDKIKTSIDGKALVNKIGAYCLTCRERGTTLIPDSITEYKMISIDSVLIDTLVISESGFRFHDSSPDRTINDSSVFIDLKLSNNFRSETFYTKDGSQFSSIQYGYQCKCNSFLSFKNDSLFFSMYRMESYDYSLSCKGIKKN